MRLTLFAMLVVLSGCAGLKVVDRGDWVLVTTKNEGRELITRDEHEAEVAAGKGREWQDALAKKPPVLTDLGQRLSVAQGDYLVLRLNEGRETELLSTEGAIRAWWTTPRKIDGWSGDSAVETKESTLFVLGKSPGIGKLKLVDSTWGTQVYEIEVTPSKR